MSSFMKSEVSIGEEQACNLGGIISSNTIYGTLGSFVTIGSTKKRKFTNREKLDLRNIDKIVFNKPTTIIVYKDGTREISRSFEEDFDEEKGVAMIMLNLVFDNNKSERKRFLEKYSQEKKDIE